MEKIEKREFNEGPRVVLIRHGSFVCLIVTTTPIGYVNDVKTRYCSVCGSWSVLAVAILLKYHWNC